MHVVVDTVDGPSLGRTVTDWFAVTGQASNTTVITTGDADGFFDLIAERVATL